jgi:hypothetical protein
MDGSAFPTLPVISDPIASSPALHIGDSFEIAVHLQNAHISSDPSRPLLFPASEGNGSIAEQRAFNDAVNEVFTIYGAPLAGVYMPFDPRTEAADKADMLSRFPAAGKWEDFEIPKGSARRNEVLAAFEGMLDQKLGGRFPGPTPFVDGRETPMYADFVIGGWLQFMRTCLPEWEALRDEWAGGKWGKLFDALEEWAAVDGREGVKPKRR